MEKTSNREMNYFLNEAKECLVSARIERQKATIAREEFDCLDITSRENIASHYENRAKEMRQDARLYLREFEVRNGVRFMTRQRIFPLKSALCGRNFKIWNAYVRQYEDESYFKGADPE